MDCAQKWFYAFLTIYRLSVLMVSNQPRFCACSYTIYNVLNTKMTPACIHFFEDDTVSQTFGPSPKRTRWKTAINVLQTSSHNLQLLLSAVLLSTTHTSILYLVAIPTPNCNDKVCNALDYKPQITVSIFCRWGRKINNWFIRWYIVYIVKYFYSFLGLLIILGYHRT